MEGIVWLKLPVTRNDEVIIPRSLFGVREVGNDFVFRGPQLEVIDVAFFRFQATHGITVLEISKSNPNVLLFG